jgi:Na+/H+ antiporter NhaC
LVIGNHNNNTVSIVITGPIAKEINDEYDLNLKDRYFRYLFLYCSRNFALWTQVLLILSFANGKLDFFDLISNAWYHLFY